MTHDEILKRMQSEHAAIVRQLRADQRAAEKKMKEAQKAQSDAFERQNAIHKRNFEKLHDEVIAARKIIAEMTPKAFNAVREQHAERTAMVQALLERTLVGSTVAASIRSLVKDPLKQASMALKLLETMDKSDDWWRAHRSIKIETWMLYLGGKLELPELRKSIDAEDAEVEGGE